MTGNCVRISAAPLRPISTSCCGVKLFFGGLTGVCARRPVTETDNASTRTAARSFFIAGDFIADFRSLSFDAETQRRREKVVSRIVLKRP